MELGTYSDLTSFIGEAFPYYRTWQSFTLLFWVGLYLRISRRIQFLFRIS